MITNRMGSFGLIAGGLIAGLSLTATQGCDPGDLAEQCGLTCDEEAFLNGKFAVSGIAEVDAFFSATLDVSGAINATALDIEAELKGLYALVGVEAAADFKAAFDAKVSAFIDGGIEIKAEPARCEASLDVTAKAAAECDVMAKPGSVEVSCSGACEVDVNAQADCRAAGGLTCKGTAPDFKCSGSCTGGCDLTAAAACDGTCRGQCNGMDFEGRCDGMCQGQCELSAGGSCNGSCTGTCEYDPGELDCQAGAEVRCSATADAKVECKGGCDGKATPPEVSAECEATVEAKAEASVQCYPPSLDVQFRFAAGIDANGQVEFKAFISNFKLRYAALLAAVKRAQGLIDVTAKLGGAGVAAVNGAAGELKASGDLKASIGAACAIKLLPQAGNLITESAGKLKTQLDAAVSVTGSLTGG
ncbi:hypothetical protein [Nannocystis punicea]|uniref:Uncharacterized protein n=1 Tax=Nannocystis punicea TaxID=2995304 RepID=A0ABY7H0U6_9BACT|nr:hypothetical protein [Nannocystis poenicansa]WAS92871.1 hypothetical protein O0S08_42410 [Nannocystis poenicansa]